MKTTKKRRTRARHEGITLIELLVVIFIMLLITAIAIPTMIPSIEGRRLRETSRVITSHFQGARTRAIQTSRTFGVMIEPQSGLTNAGITLSYMAESEPWSGDTNETRAFVRGSLPTTPSPYALLDRFINITTGQEVQEGWLGLVRPGDEIQFNGTGRRYVITSGEPFTDSNANGTWNNPEPFVDLDADSTYDAPQLVKGTINALPWTLTAQNVPPNPDIPSTNPPFNLDANTNGMFDTGDMWNGNAFTVFRQPTKTAAHPVQLPNAMVVDLAFSGTSGLPALNGLGPITILFTPGGALSSIHFYQNNLAQAMTPSSPLFLHVGKVDKIGNTATGERNFEDQNNFWVTIHPQTGLITSTEVGPDEDSDGTISLNESRYFAVRGMSMGGR